MSVFTPQPEITTAATNLLIFAGAVLCSVGISKKREINRERKNCWLKMFVLLSCASLCGFLVHGLMIFRATELVYRIAWMPQSVLLCATMSAVAIATVNEMNVQASFLKKTKTFFWLFCAAGSILMVVLSFFIKKYFLVFTVYAGICFIIALGIDFYLAFAKGKKNCLISAAGIIMIVLSGLLQATWQDMLFTVIWQFNHNGVAHILIALSLPFFYVGYVKGIDGSNKA